MFYYVIYNSSITSYVENQKKYLTTLLYGSILYILTHAYLSSSNSKFVRAIKPYFWIIILLDIASMYYLYQQGDGQTDWLNNINNLRNKINNYIKTDQNIQEQSIEGKNNNKVSFKLDNKSQNNQRNIQDNELDDNVDYIDNTNINNTNEDIDDYNNGVNGVNGVNGINDNINANDEEDNISVPDIDTNTQNINNMLSQLTVDNFNDLKPNNTQSTSLSELRQRGRAKIKQKKNTSKSNKKSNTSMQNKNSNKISQNVSNNEEIHRPSKEIDDMFSESCDESGSEVDFDINEFSSMM